MIMGIKNAELLIGMVMTLIAYFISVSIIGFFRAWVADKMGDSTPERMGFLTLNPVMHTSKLWVFWIIMLQYLHQYVPFGLGQHIPIDPDYIHGRYRGLRVALAYLSDSIASLFLSLIAFFTLLVFYKNPAQQFLSHAITLKNLSLISAGASSFNIVMIWLLITFFLFNGIGAVFTFLINIFHFTAFYLFPHKLKDSEHGDLIVVFGPLIFIFVFARLLETYTLWWIRNIALAVGNLCGLL